MTQGSLTGTHVLVPLDGSELAERAIPLAARIAAALRSTLVLMRITPRTGYAVRWTEEALPATVYPTHAEDEKRAAERYLASVASPLRQRGLTIQTIVEQGEPAPTVLHLLVPLQIGMIVMATHGRMGMARLSLGSVADVLVRESRVPVLLIRPLLSDQRNEALDRAIIPLDGSETSEAALDIAVSLAGALIHAMTLVHVVPDQEARSEGSRMENATRYLDNIRRRLAEQVAGGATIESHVLSGDAARIIQCAEGQYDLIIMATHGATDTRRAVFGSVADRVLHDTATPLLLVCPEPARGL